MKTISGRGRHTGALAGALNGWYCVPSHRAPYRPGFLERVAARREARAP